MSKILMLGNSDIAIYNFKLELVERLLSEGHKVIISSPYGERIDDLIAMGCEYHDISISRHGTNPLQEMKLLNEYNKLVKYIDPDIALTFTIKPGIYGSMACKKHKIPYVVNITGLGTAVENPGIMQFITVSLYKIALSKAKTVFFQNRDNMRFFENHRIALKKHKLLPGSGVNLTRFSCKPYPSGNIIKFAFISRIMKEKGIEQYLEAARYIKQKYENTEFHICGFCEPEYKGKLQEYADKEYVIYHGMIKDVPDFIETMHCIVHPSYYPEGISNVLLEACATGRPIITTDRSGCREVVEDGVNGFKIPVRDENALIAAIEKFISLSNDEREKMGLAGRNKVEREFDREIVVREYLKELERL